MGVMRHSEPDIDRSLDLVAKQLRDDGFALVDKPLPQRWVDLLLYLIEQEKRRELLSSESISSG